MNNEPTNSIQSVFGAKPLQTQTQVLTFRTRTKNAPFFFFLISRFAWFWECSHSCHARPAEVSVVCAAFRSRPSVTLNSKSRRLTGCRPTWRIVADRSWRLLLRAAESDHKDLMRRLSASPQVNSSLWIFQENQRFRALVFVRAHANRSHASTHTHVRNREILIALLRADLKNEGSLP